MALTHAGEGVSELRCSIGFDAPQWVTAAGAMVGNNHFVNRHLVEETGNFARDIANKYGPSPRPDQWATERCSTVDRRV